MTATEWEVRYLLIGKLESTTTTNKCFNKMKNKFPDHMSFGGRNKEKKNVEKKEGK
jgi:hypothetical protein